MSSRSIRKGSSPVRPSKQHFQDVDFSPDECLKADAVPQVFSAKTLSTHSKIRDKHLKPSANTNAETGDENLSGENVVFEAIPAAPHDGPRPRGRPRTRSLKPKKRRVARGLKAASPPPTDAAKEQEVKTEPAVLDLNMTCEDEALSQYQLAVLQPHFTRSSLKRNASRQSKTKNQNATKCRKSERIRKPNVIHSSDEYASPQSRTQSQSGIKKRQVKKITLYVRPKAAAKASIPFLEPAFRELRNRPRSVRQDVPKLKPGAVRTIDEGLETHLERVFSATLRKYYSRRFATGAQTNPDVKTPNSTENIKTDSGRNECMCAVCGEMVRNNITLAAHVQWHIENISDPAKRIDLYDFASAQTKCELCSKLFQNPFDLIMHYDCAHIHEIGEYQCRICEQRHGCLLELVAHLNLSHCGVEMPYRCEECNFRTSFYVDALNHIATFHKGGGNFFCPMCLAIIEMEWKHNEPKGSGAEEAEGHLGYYDTTKVFDHIVQHYDRLDGPKITTSKLKYCRKCVLQMKMIKYHLRSEHPNIVAGAKANYSSDEAAIDEQLETVKEPNGKVSPTEDMTDPLLEDEEYYSTFFPFIERLDQDNGEGTCNLDVPNDNVNITNALNHEDGASDTRLARAKGIKKSHQLDEESNSDTVTLECNIPHANADSQSLCRNPSYLNNGDLSLGCLKIPMDSTLNRNALGISTTRIEASRSTTDSVLNNKMPSADNNLLKLISSQDVATLNASTLMLNSSELASSGGMIPKTVNPEETYCRTYNGDTDYPFPTEIAKFVDGESKSQIRIHDNPKFLIQNPRTHRMPSFGAINNTDQVPLNHTKPEGANSQPAILGVGNSPSEMLSLRRVSTAKKPDMGHRRFREIRCFECGQKINGDFLNHYCSTKQCDICRFTTNCKEAFERHIYEIHGPAICEKNLGFVDYTRSMQCHHCGFNTCDGNDMAQHMVISKCPNIED